MTNQFREDKISAIYSAISNLERLMCTTEEYNLPKEVFENLYNAHKILDSMREEDL